jgi:hypothetical protein
VEDNIMQEEQIEDWTKVFETYDYMLSELSEAKLTDENIEYQIMNKADIGYTMDVGNSALGREAVGLPFKFFVKPENADKARELLNADNSKMLDDPNLDFDHTEPQ